MLDPGQKLGDFGAARNLDASGEAMSVKGTPAYMAPEQWEARRQSAATDQYSLAVGRRYFFIFDL